MKRSVNILFAVAAALAVIRGPVQAQTALPQPLQDTIDAVVTRALAKTGVPSASVAVVSGGRVAMVKAYGEAKIDPHTPAATGMRYAVGSISKQFTAAALLLLQEDGKVSLDDKVAKYLPDLTRAGDVSIRQLLSHTSGYQDYWPQDYVMPFILQPVTADQILDRWARKPLDFDPGTQYQYSNTNYVIAGLIVEKTAGRPLLEFLRQRIFSPLEMKSVADLDDRGAAAADAAGYLRYALGPLRPAPPEGKGWMFAAGELTMTAEDLARWDIAIMDGKILSPSSLRQLETEVVLANGLGTGYGLGVGVGSIEGHRSLSHGGEVSGFTAQNTVLPDDRLAVVALTNQDAARAAGMIARNITSALLKARDTASGAKLALARTIFEGLQHGTIDRSLFTENANGYFSDQALQDCAASLGPLGPPLEFTQVSEGLRGGMTGRSFRIRFAQRSLRAWTYEMPDGKLEQYQIAEQD